MGGSRRWIGRSLSVFSRNSADSTVRRVVGLSLFVLYGALLVSCGGEPRLVPPPDPTPSSSIGKAVVPGATPRAIATPGLGRIVWTAAIDQTTNAPTEPVSRYGPTAPRIIAAVPVPPLPAGSRIEATWEYNDTSLDAFTTQLFPSEMTDQAWITFHIERDPSVPWPVGTYEISVSVDETTIEVAEVEVSE